MTMLQRLLYSPFLAQLVVTRRCNLTCGYCNEYDTFSKPVAERVLRSRLRKLKALGTWTIEFTGGEPLLHPKIVNLVKYAREIGFFRVQMISNCFKMNSDVIAALNQAGLYHLQVSIDGVNPNATTNKVLKSLRKRLELLAKQARFKVTLSAVIGAAHNNEAIEVIGFAKQNGFRPRALLLHGNDGQLNLSTDQIERYTEVQQAIGRNYNEAGDYRMKLAKTGTSPFKCRSGSRYLYIDEDGLVSWCSQKRESFSKPLQDYSLQDLRQQFHTPKSCNGRCTLGCARTNSKVDEWRSQTGD